MPNVAPQDLPIEAKGRNGRSPICGTSACVDAVETDGAILVTSTIEGNEGHVAFTFQEWNGFLDEVKADKWDHTYRR